MNAPRHLRARAMIVTAISPPERTEVVAHYMHEKNAAALA
jgi:hypothetical protein